MAALEEGGAAAQYSAIDQNNAALKKLTEFWNVIQGPGLWNS